MLTKLEERVEKLLKDTIESLGYELYDVEYVKEVTNLPDFEAALEAARKSC